MLVHIRRRDEFQVNIGERQSADRRRREEQ